MFLGVTPRDLEETPHVLAPLITAGLGGISRLQFLMQMERQINEASGRKCWYRHNEAIFFRVALRILSPSPGRFSAGVQFLFAAFKRIYRCHYARDTVYR